MSTAPFREAVARLAEIDALQDDVLRQLDELERRSAAVLADCLRAAATTTGDVASSAERAMRSAA